MSAPARLAAFAVAALAVFGAGYGIGEAVGPEVDAPAERGTHDEHPEGREQ